MANCSNNGEHESLTQGFKYETKFFFLKQKNKGYTKGTWNLQADSKNEMSRKSVVKPEHFTPALEKGY